VKILAMTATFGKLSRQSLTLEPGLNIIDAPNEWGKSTWCAFVMAMLYGINTRASGDLAEKNRYAPWSGEPMAGSMQILWKDCQITLERQSKGRTPLGEVKAYETLTGVRRPELEVSAPGHILLGVERNVFERAGFIRQAEMPVTEDEALRRRLNELVTTGDESGASDALQDKLNKLKNKCKHNKTGLIPEAENNLKEINDRLEQLTQLKAQVASITQQEAHLQNRAELLENHKQALLYAEQLEYTQKLAAAQVRRDAQAEAQAQAQTICENLPAREKVQEDLSAAQQLREIRDSLHAKLQLLPPLPQEPVTNDAFRGRDPQNVEADAAQDVKAYIQLTKTKKTPIFQIAGGAAFVIGVVLAIALGTLGIILGTVLALGGVGLFAYGIMKQKNLQKQLATLTERYRGIPFDHWTAAAAEYARGQMAYQKTLQTRQAELSELNRLLAENTGRINTLTENLGISAFEEQCRLILQNYTNLEEQQRLLRQAEDVVQALVSADKKVAPPRFADTLTETKAETESALTENDVQRRLLHQRLGQCQGQMETLGQEEALRAQKAQLETRIAKLEQYNRALILAQETLQQATQELQRRFAPQISNRAQEIFGRLTGGRYEWVSLREDLSLQTRAADEIGQRNTLLRSDGTVDQLYLSLRMAVAEALTPDAPLVLDDALVRFDDVRLATTLELLQQEAEKKQIILFTCHSREREFQEGTK